MNSLRDRRLSKIRRQRLFLVVGLPLVSLCLTILLLNIFIKPQRDTISKTTQVAPVEKAPVVERVLPPTRLKISGIGVDTSIKPVGLTVDGDMAIDDSIDSVAWYQAGPRPGEKGSAVIAGHYGWKDGQASIFNELHTLKAGDSVTVYDEKQTETSFVVRETRDYDPEADATEVFRSNDGKVHLNLITCIGTWNKSLQTYSKRLVIFTDMIDPTVI